MDITKPNDIFVATVINPQATSYDLLSNGFSGENTSLFSKENYKNTDFVKDKFSDKDGVFNEIAFNQAYDAAQQNYINITNEEYINNLDEVIYSPFDITRPKFAKTFNVSTVIEKDFNPYKYLYGYTGVQSVDENPFSNKELAQTGKIFDHKTGKFLDMSANELPLWKKFFGDTLVYAQWDEDGFHTDPFTGQEVQHSEGEWKYDENGDFYTELLGGREVYGKQVVHPFDILTVDGSVMDKYNFLDSDDKEKSITGSIFKTAFKIAPYFIPNIGPLKGAMSIRSLYGALNVGIGLSGALPTLYKSMEGFLLGDKNTLLTEKATQLEGWMAKHTSDSISDKGSQSILSFEQIASMVVGIFSQIHEQRAMASLSKVFKNTQSVQNEKLFEISEKINKELINGALEGKIKITDLPKLRDSALARIPEVQDLLMKQNNLSKALSLSYMALISTSDVYGEALAGGYDKRTAGFAALASAAGQYTLMMNNRMGDWFLDKSTGYNLETNRALVLKATENHYKEVQEAWKAFAKNKKNTQALGHVFGKIKNGIESVFLTPSTLFEAMWKNSIVEGIEEVTEEVVEDTIKGIIDIFSYFGITPQKGSFGGWGNVFSREGLQNYVANFTGGVIGGSLFELHRLKIEPMFNPKNLDVETKKSFYEYVGEGKANEMRKMIEQRRKFMGNEKIAYDEISNNIKESTENSYSQSDFVTDNMLGMIDLIEGIFNSHDVIQSDDDVIRKAIKDELLIQRLNAVSSGDSEVGIEGLPLKDFKKHLEIIADSELELKELRKTLGEEGEKTDKGKFLNKKIKESKEIVKNILEGNYGNDYHRKALFFLDSNIHKAFLNIDKARWTLENYGVDYTKLPKTGSNISQQSIDKQWREFLNSKDIEKDLDIADKLYQELEKTLNPFIKNYVETGYSEERTKTLKLLKDIRNTINKWQLSEDPNQREQLFKEFTELNNLLISQGQQALAPWTVVQDNIYDELKDLGLIKHIEYSIDEDGNITSNIYDVNEESLNKIIEGSELTTDEIFKALVTSQFKGLNPLNLKEPKLQSQSNLDIGQTINEFNLGVQAQNFAILEKIKKLLMSENADSEETKEQINQLRNGLFNIHIAPISETTIIKDIISNYETKKENILTENNIEPENFEKYLYLSELKEFNSKNTFETLLKEIKQDASNIEDLNRLEYLLFLDKLWDNPAFNEAYQTLKKSSSDFETVYNNNLILLKDENISAEQLREVKESFEPFISLIKTTIENNSSLYNNNIYKEAKTKIDKAFQEKEQEVKENTPDLFKIKNRTLQSSIEFLKQGTADKEAYNFAQETYNEVASKFMNKVFPFLTNASYKEAIPFIEMFEDLIKQIESDINENNASYGASGEDWGNINLQKYINNLPEGNFGIFKTEEVLNFIKKYAFFDENVDNFKSRLIDSVKSLKTEKLTKKLLDEFLAIPQTLDLISNPIYDFIRDFTITLNSDPNNKTAKIFEILKNEEILLKGVSNINNYGSDTFREQNINQALDVIEMIKSVVYAMSTTEINYSDPIGFIASRQNYAKKHGLQDEVLNLKTISSDVAHLMQQDLDLIATKLNFLKEFALNNSGKLLEEQKIIQGKVENILLGKWTEWLKAFPEIFPSEKIQEILDSDKSQANKLMEIEEAFHIHNKDSKIDVLNRFLLELPNIDLTDSEPMTRDIKQFTDSDLIKYIATILSINSKNFYKRSLISLKGEFNKAPLFTQEFIARQTIAQINNPDLFSLILESKSYSNWITADRFAVIQGSAGTGKTTASFGITLEHIKQTNDNTVTWLSAPHDKQVETLYNSIKETTGLDGLEIEKKNKNALFEALGIKNITDQIKEELSNITNPNYEKTIVQVVDGSIQFTEDFKKGDWLKQIDLTNLPNLLLIDEITHYSAFEIYLMSEIAKVSVNADNSSEMFIIAAGDPTQLGYLIEVNGIFLNNGVEFMNIISTPRLWSSLRNSNVQKKTNGEKIDRLVNNLTTIYSQHARDLVTARDTAINFLQDSLNAKLTELNYFQGDDFIHGDKIVNTLTKEVLQPIIEDLKKNPEKRLGILTENAKTIENLPEYLSKVLTDAGLILPDGTAPNLQLFTTADIQGSEIDYLLFDVEITKKFDKLRDNLKAFYTYITRAINASIIIDSENFIESKYKIVQAEPDLRPQMFEILTPELIEKVKQEKIKFYEDILGNDLLPNDNFKWKIGDTVEDLELSGGRYVSGIESTIRTDSDNLKKSEEKGLKDGFKVLTHSFFNNPNVPVTDLEKGIITVNSSRPKTDLNGISNVDVTDSKKIIEEWLKLKNDLLHNWDYEKLNTTNYRNFFKHIFGLENNALVDVKFVITATPAYKEYNTPYKKQGFDAQKVLDSSKKIAPLINVSVELTYDSKKHYITLTTFGTEENILKKAKEYNIDSKQIENQFKNVIKKLEKNNFLVFNLDTKELSYLTSTILQDIKVENTKKNQTFTLDSLQDEFPGMSHSEIRFIPYTRKEFVELFNKHVFGTKRDMEIEQYEDSEGNVKNRFKDEDLEKRYVRIRNKPYVVVSYDGDINGKILPSDATEGNVLSRIVMIGSESRGLETLINEVTDLLSRRNEEVRQAYRNKEANLISNETNARTEILLNRNDIVESLITWGTTSTNNKTNPQETFLDLLFKEISFSISDTIEGTKTSVFEIFTKFNRSAKQINSQQLKKIVDEVQNVIKKDTTGKREAIKKAILDKIQNIKYWHWGFFNIFGYEAIINNFSDNEFYKYYTDGVVDDKFLEMFNKNENVDKMKGIIKSLLDVIKDQKFYYSIPIKPGKDGSTIIANPIIDGKNGFTKDNYGDKFFINVAPESSKIMLGIDAFLNLLNNEITEKSKNEVKKEPTSKPEPIIEKNSTENIESTESIESTENSIKNIESTESAEHSENIFNLANKIFPPSEGVNVAQLLSSLLEVNPNLEGILGDKLNNIQIKINEKIQNNLKVQLNEFFKEFLGEIGIARSGPNGDMIDLSSLVAILNLDRTIQENQIVLRNINSIISDHLKKVC